MNQENEQPIVLIADSQISVLSEARDGLPQALPGWRVITSDTGRAALETLKRTEIQLVLADMKLGDMSGLKLLSKAKTMYPAATTVLTSDCGSEEVRRMCRESGIDFFLEKPIDAKQLVGLLGERRPRTASVFRGKLENLAVPDVLQLVLCRPPPMLMRLDGPRGEGAIEIENGEVTHARANGQVGEEAFYELVSWREGNFEVVDVICSEERTIVLPVAQLLLNAARRLEHCETDSAAPAPSAADPTAKPFFAKEEEAPDVGHLWAPMANYTRPQIGRNRRTAGYQVETARSTLPPIRAFRHRADAGQSLRVRMRERGPSRFTPPTPGTGDSTPGRRRRVRLSRKSVAPAARRVALAGVASALFMFVVVRESGFLSAQYGRDVVPFLDDFILEFIPGAASEAEGEMGMVRASAFDQGSGRRISDKDVAYPTAADGASSMTFTVGLSADSRLARLPNAVGVSEDVYRRHRFDLNPWVEVIGPTGKRIGAMAVHLPDARFPVLVNQAMYDILSHRRVELSQVRLRKVQWMSKGSVASLSFNKSPHLPGAYCEYLYSVGVGLETMQYLGLTPGAHAVVRGPQGNTTVRVQLVDRGEDGEIWLSQSVRDAIGAQESDSAVKLFPKT